LRNEPTMGTSSVSSIPPLAPFPKSGINSLSFSPKESHEPSKMGRTFRSEYLKRCAFVAARVRLAAIKRQTGTRGQTDQDLSVSIAVVQCRLRR
jgi:hypothetical protein